MTTIEKTKIIKIFYCVYLILLIGFIFNNSMASKEVSAEKSTAVLDSVNKILESAGVEYRLEHVVVRKLGHIIEYFALGASIFGYLVINKTVNFKNCIYCSFVACVIGMIDETIQYYVGRGSMVLDVWLDFVSAVLGISLAYLIYILISKKLKKRV